MNEARFKAVFNGLSSIAKTVYEAIPDDSYYSIKRVHSELCRLGKNVDVSTLSGVLNTLTKAGVLSEVDQGMFSKVKITKKVLSKAQEIEYADTKLPPKEPKKEIAVPEINAKQEADAFDSLRETVIKFMDVAKLVNTLASEVDAKLAVVEKQLAANNQQMAKYKQLKSLLSDI